MRHIKLVIFASPNPATTCDVRMRDDVWEAHVANARKANVTIADDGTRVVVIVSRDDASTCLVMQELRSCARCDEAPVVSGDVMCATCRAHVIEAQRAEGLVCLACPTALCSERDGDSDYCEACRADPDDVCGRTS